MQQPISDINDDTAPFMNALPAGNKTDIIFLPEDRRICEEILVSAKQCNDVNKPVSELVVSVGFSFLGAPYESRTLECNGAEPLVANLRAFDCATFVETVVAAVLTIKSGKETMADFLFNLEKIRYRKGLRDGYASRLHYFTDWIWDNQRMGFLRDETPDLGGVPVKKALHEITNHRSSHEQLQDKNVLRKMREVETVCSKRTYHYIPRESWRSAEGKIEQGDIIAVATNKEAIDIIHVGFAILKNKRVYLLHASSNAKMVTLSDMTLYRYLGQRSYRTGIIVARLLDPNALKRS